MPSSLELPRGQLAILHEQFTRLLESRKVGTDAEHFVREVLETVQDTVQRAGLDGVLDALGVETGAELADHEGHRAAVITQLHAIDLDDGSPRNAKPRVLADRVLAGLGLVLVDPPDRTLTLPGALRGEVMAVVAAVIEPGLALPQFRDAIIDHAKTRCDEQYIVAFDKLAAQLDERGMKIVKLPKLPLDAVHAVQRVLAAAREAVIGRIVGAAIDRAKPLIERANAEAAARIDKPITHKLTPRSATILRACDPRLPKIPAALTPLVVDSLAALAELAWAVEEKVRAYGASQTFVVGELIEHIKFGRGTVASVVGTKIEVEFADGKRSLVHTPPRK